VIASHIGTNPETQRLMLAGQLAVELVPQGTIAERIRAGGAGLGGVLTATGIGTLAADGRQVVKVDGREFLVEPALKGRCLAIDVPPICWKVVAMTRMRSSSREPITSSKGGGLIGDRQRRF
jgi:hypothetical protein